MPVLFTKQLLSASTNGKQIKLTGTTNGAANTVHTTGSSLTLDEVWLYAYNDDSVTHILSVLWGGTTEPDNVIRATLPSKAGRTLICDGMLLNGSLSIKAYADGGSIMLDGFVNHLV